MKLLALRKHPRDKTLIIDNQMNIVFRPFQLFINEKDPCRTFEIRWKPYGLKVVYLALPGGRSFSLFWNMGWPYWVRRLIKHR